MITAKGDSHDRACQKESPSLPGQNLQSGCQEGWQLPGHGLQLQSLSSHDLIPNFKHWGESHGLPRELTVDSNIDYEGAKYESVPFTCIRDRSLSHAG